MKIAAHIIGSYQVSESDYQRHVVTYVFDSSKTIDEIIAATGEKDLSALNLSTVKEIPECAKNTEQQVQLDSEQKQGTFDNPVDASNSAAPRELT